MWMKNAMTLSQQVKINLSEFVVSVQKALFKKLADFWICG